MDTTVQNLTSATSVQNLKLAIGVRDLNTASSDKKTQIAYLLPKS